MTNLRHAANDPFDYEQKYPDDEEYKEMGPMARIWKVFLDECGKFDTEMVENWRDALDVLLVFVSLTGLSCTRLNEHVGWIVLCRRNHFRLSNVPKPST